MIHTKRILFIAGSVRPNRISPVMARWIAERARACVQAECEVIDLRAWPLPMDAEPGIPAMGHYDCPQTRAWSAKVVSADAIVFVTPQYNWGYPAPLKNAIDHLYREWTGKPALIVTYGGHGGGKCATALRQVLEGLKMRPVSTMPAFTLPRPVIESNAGALNPGALFGDAQAELDRAFAELSAALDTTVKG